MVLTGTWHCPPSQSCCRPCQSWCSRVRARLPRCLRRTPSRLIRHHTHARRPSFSRLLGPSPPASEPHLLPLQVSIPERRGRGGACVVRRPRALVRARLFRLPAARAPKRTMENATSREGCNRQPELRVREAGCVAPPWTAGSPHACLAEEEPQRCRRPRTDAPTAAVMVEPPVGWMPPARFTDPDRG